MAKDYENPPTISQLVGINNKLGKTNRELTKSLAGAEAEIKVLKEITEIKDPEQHFEQIMAANKQLQSALAEKVKQWEMAQGGLDVANAFLAEKEAELKDVITSNAFLELIKEEQSEKLTTQAKEIEGLRGALEKARLDVAMICPGLNRNNALKHIKQALAEQTLKDTK